MANPPGGPASSSTPISNHLVGVDFNAPPPAPAMPLPGGAAPAIAPAAVAGRAAILAPGAAPALPIPGAAPADPVVFRDPVEEGIVNWLTALGTEFLSDSKGNAILSPLGIGELLVMLVKSMDNSADSLRILKKMGLVASGSTIQNDENLQKVASKVAAILQEVKRKIAITKGEQQITSATAVYTQMARTNPAFITEMTKEFHAVIFEAVAELQKWAVEDKDDKIRDPAMRTEFNKLMAKIFEKLRTGENSTLLMQMLILNLDIETTFNEEYTAPGVVVGVDGKRTPAMIMKRYGDVHVLQGTYQGSNYTLLILDYVPEGSNPNSFRACFYLIPENSKDLGKFQRDFRKILEKDLAAFGWAKTDCVVEMPKFYVKRDVKMMNALKGRGYIAPEMDEVSLGRIGPGKVLKDVGQVLVYEKNENKMRAVAASYGAGPTGACAIPAIPKPPLYVDATKPLLFMEADFYDSQKYNLDLKKMVPLIVGRVEGGEEMLVTPKMFAEGERAEGEREADVKSKADLDVKELATLWATVISAKEFGKIFFDNAGLLKLGIYDPIVTAHRYNYTSAGGKAVNKRVINFTKHAVTFNGNTPLLNGQPLREALPEGSAGDKPYAIPDLSGDFIICEKDGKLYFYDDAGDSRHLICVDPKSHSITKEPFRKLGKYSTNYNDEPPIAGAVYRDQSDVKFNAEAERKLQTDLALHKAGNPIVQALCDNLGAVLPQKIVSIKEFAAKSNDGTKLQIFSFAKRDISTNEKREVLVDGKVVMGMTLPEFGPVVFFDGYDGRLYVYTPLINPQYPYGRILWADNKLNSGKLNFSDWMAVALLNDPTIKVQGIAISDFFHFCKPGSNGEIVEFRAISGVIANPTSGYRRRFNQGKGIVDFLMYTKQFQVTVNEQGKIVINGKETAIQLSDGPHVIYVFEKDGKLCFNDSADKDNNSITLVDLTTGAVTRETVLNLRTKVQSNTKW